MHSLSWWRMVGRVMEGEGGAPLTNEIKIFKHCFMTLLVPLCYLPAAGEGRTPSGVWHHGCVITLPTTFVSVGFKVWYMEQIPPRHHHPQPQSHVLCLPHGVFLLSEAITGADPIGSPVCHIIFLPFIYCRYTRSASYNLIVRPSCDNEGCRF